MISIICIISDKDYHNLKNILHNIEETAAQEYELLVADNRNEHKQAKLPEGKYRLVDMCGNQFQFTAKKRCIPMCKGEYIWCIDGDDAIVSFPTINSDADMICYNFQRDDGLKPLRWISNDEDITENIFHLSTHWKTSTVMWCTLLKKSMLMKFIEKLPEVRIHNFEDFLWIVFSLYHSNKLSFRTQIIYQYNARYQDSARKYYDSIEPLERWATGTTAAITLMNEIIPLEEQFKSGIRSEDIYRNGCINFIEKYYSCNPEIRRKFFNLMLKYFKRDYILNQLNLYSGPGDKQELLNMILS